MKNESVVIQIANGKRPSKPQAADHLGLTEEMWKFIGKCWTPNPNKRPTIDEVVRTWEGFVNGHVSAPMPSARRSQFAEPSTVSAEKPMVLPSRGKRFCGLF